MKRFFLSLTTLGIFFVYSLGIRHQRPVLIKPKIIRSQSSSSQKSTTSNTNSSSSNNSSTNNINNGSNTSNSSTSSYKDGTYTGPSVNAYYGQVQVSVGIKNGKINQVNFLSYPNSHSTSVYINQQAMPYLKQEAIQVQNPNNLQIITGATFTSEAFIQSITSALSKAH